MHWLYFGVAAAATSGFVKLNKIAHAQSYRTLLGVVTRYLQNASQHRSPHSVRNGFDQLEIVRHNLHGKVLFEHLIIRVMCIRIIIHGPAHHTSTETTFASEQREIQASCLSRLSMAMGNDTRRGLSGRRRVSNMVWYLA
jgi:hypothetical protein